jgi:uncharacterized membrane protein
MSIIEKSTDVDAPVRTVYNQWTQFEEFPRFMDGVERVEQLDETRLHWVAEIGGQRREWDAQITEQVPDQRIVWTSTDGPYTAGAVTFHRLGDDKTRVSDDKTRVMLQLEFDPDGFVEQVGDKLGIIERRVAGDLNRFKEFLESRGQETGAWRGEVHHSETAVSR